MCYPCKWDANTLVGISSRGHIQAQLAMCRVMNRELEIAGSRCSATFISEAQAIIHVGIGGGTSSTIGIPAWVHRPR